MNSVIVNHDATAVIVLGASRFKKSPTLDRDGFRFSAEDFVDYVLDKRLLSLPAVNLLNLFDSQLPPGDQLEAVCDFLSSQQAAAATKDVILYYIGHGGFVGVNQAYFLAIAATTEGMEGPTAIRIGDLSSALRDHARHSRKYLIPRLLLRSLSICAIPRFQPIGCSQRPGVRTIARKWNRIALFFRIATGVPVPSRPIPHHVFRGSNGGTSKRRAQRPSRFFTRRCGQKSQRPFTEETPRQLDQTRAALPRYAQRKRSRRPDIS